MTTLSTNPDYKNAFRCKCEGNLEGYRHHLVLCINTTDGDLHKAMLLRFLAGSFVDTGNYDDALRYYNNAVEIDPSPDSYYATAEFAFYRLKNPDHAKKLLELADRRAASFIDTHFSPSLFRKKTAALHAIVLGSDDRTESDGSATDQTEQ